MRLGGMSKASGRGVFGGQRWNHFICDWAARHPLADVLRVKKARLAQLLSSITNMLPEYSSPTPFLWSNLERAL